LIAFMATHDDIFEVRIGRMGRDRVAIQGPMQGVIGRAKRAGSGAAKTAKSSGLRAHFRKGGGKPTRGFSGAQRRVVVKARIVAHGAGKAAPLKTHVAYLAREGRANARSAAPEIERAAVAPEAAPALATQVDYLARDGAEDRGLYVFYDGAREGVDAKAMTASWADDTRHFRLIISAEDGAALGDLKPFVREVMGDLEAKLGTRLEWAAVDHWDTDNPHTHVLIRGRRADGTDLVIPRKIISHGIREHAQEVATRVLGPRPALSPDVSRAKEIASPALTPLDRELMNRARNGLLDAPENGRTDLIGRLERLEVWGLAARHGDGRWALADDLKTNLEALGERIEINRMLERVEGLALADFDILEADRSAPAIGRLVHVGMVDELSERTIAVIEDAHGALRYAGFDRTEDLAVFAGVERGAIVEFEPRTPALKPADQAVARVAAETGGLYSPAHHAALEPHADPALMAANVRRLEAMRRAGFVARRPDGAFEIAPNHQKRALKYEAKRLARTPVQARIASYWTLGEQEQALGLTHLDRVLARDEPMPDGPGGFTREFEAALQRRRLFLIEQGVMGRTDMALSPDAVDRLASRELQSTAHRLEQQLGRPVLTHLGAHVEGVYARRIDLAQGRYALLWQRETAQLVPWRPALELFAGRHVQGVVRGQSISWGLWRGRTVGLPPM
jgi:type IV secretory pathway VirD2 relaxase